MRWFKHPSDSANNQKLIRLLEAMGGAGYGYYWLVLELLAEQVQAPGNFM